MISQYISQDSEDQKIKFSVMRYLSQDSFNEQGGQSPVKKCRSQSGVFYQDPPKNRKDSNLVKKNVGEEEIIKQIKKLNDLLINYQSKLKTEIGSELVVESLVALVKVSKKVQQLTITQFPISLQQQDEDKLSFEIVSAVKQIYQRTKQNFESYMHSHLMLMDENMCHANLFRLLKEFVFHLVGCEQFSFLTVKDDKIDIYQTLTDQFLNQDLNNDILSELNHIESQRVMEWQQVNYYPLLSKLFCNENYDKSFIIKSSTDLGEFYFAFHQKDGDQITRDFLSLANDYYFFDIIQQLVIFLVETVKQARVQFFSPLQIADMIQDIGLAFVRCSKYLLIESVCKVLRQKFQLSKKIFDPYQMLSSNLGIKPVDAKIIDAVTVEFKDTLQIQINIKAMDLSKSSDHLIHKEIIQTYEKYQGFIKQCYDKIAFYKFFLRSSDSLIFEFDKKGKLTFLSRPIDKNSRESFKISFNIEMIQQEQLNYKIIFQHNQTLIDKIETSLQDEIIQWKIQKEENDNSYEVFMKIEEKNFKGFVVIFQESQKWIKNLPISLALNTQLLGPMNDQLKKTIQDTVLYQETLNYIDKLEKNNPDFKLSQVSMFKPMTSTSQIPIPIDGDKIKKRRSAFVGRVSIVNYLPQVQVDVSKFELNESDSQLDHLEFNIFTINDAMEKQRLVWAILQRNKFIEDFNIPSDQLSEFLNLIESKYSQNDNSFHNYDHAITVMQSTHRISQIVQQSEFHGMINQFTKFALILSALCHDVDHTGKTNMFEINSLSKLAVRYHDKSCLEQHHAATAIKIMQGEESNILVNLTVEEFRKFRKLFIQNILSTDLTEHFKMVKQVESQIKDKSLAVNDDDIKLLTGFIIHTADFSGGAKQFMISRQWSERVNQEFVTQFDEEGKNGYPQQPFMKNLELLHVMAKSEMGFFKVIVRPLYDLMNQLILGQFEGQINNLDNTIIEWEKVHNRALQEYEEYEQKEQ